MPGRHLAKGRGRFLWELIRYILAWVAIVAALVGVFWLIKNLLPVWLDTASTTATTTTISGTGPISVPTTSTSTTVVETTTTATVVETTTTTTTEPVPQPGELWVLVLNSTSRPGLAGGAAGLLDEAGYLVLTPDNYPTVLEVTRVLHAEGLGIAAAELANEFFPDAEVLLDTEGLTAADPDIVVILGTDYQP